MKIVKALSIAIFSLSSVVYAADGNINFTGSITTNTCKINDGTALQSVSLGKVPASSLATLGSTAGHQNFALSLTECSDSAKSVAAHFESVSLGTTDGRLNLDTASTASNVQIAIYDNKGVLQPVNGEVPANSYVTLATDTKAATLNYVASYYATGIATEGTANSSVAYTLSYQ